MSKRSNIVRTGPILMAMLGLLVFATDCRAFFYRPAAALSILSEYVTLNDSALPHVRLWKVVPEASAAGAATLRFFPGEPAGTISVCVLSLPSLRSGGEIVWKGTGERGEKRSNTGLLLVPGFPAPCDILPVGPIDEGRVYRERSEAGGRVFLKTYRIVADGSSVAEARAKGWIKVETPGAPELVMVTVLDGKGRLVVRQLWPADGSWWLYEETPFRRSWLID